MPPAGLGGSRGNIERRDEEMVGKLPWIACVAVLTQVSCLGFGAKNTIMLGECPLIVSVMAEDGGFDGVADVYINGHLIGTTDKAKGNLKIKLPRGEYDLMVTAEGYEPWEGTVLMVGKGYAQTVLARLKAEAAAGVGGGT